MNFKNYKPDSYEVTDFDKAVCLTGYGKFHYEALSVCAICVVSVGFQNGLSSYVFPAAQCEFFLTSFELGLLNVMFLTGGILSCFLWGTLADTTGRRNILIVTHWLNASVTLTCAFIPHKFGLVVCRFFNGFFIGAPGAIVFSYLAEFQPPKFRSASVCCCGLFFTSSWLLLPVLAHLVLPLNLDCRLGKFLVVTPWRLYLVLLALPEILAGVWFMRLPESPKFYVAKGNPVKALVVLRRMYSANTGKCPDSFPVKRLMVGCEDGSRKMSDSSSRVRECLRIVVRQSRTLLKHPFVTMTALTCAVMFSNMFGVYGLGLWIPELFLRFKRYHDLHPNATVTVQQLSFLAQQPHTACQPSFDPVIIRGTVFMAFASLLYNLVCSLLSARVQARIITGASMLVGGLSAGCMFWLRSSSQHLAVACAFQAAMVTANMTIGSVAVDVFPTEVAAAALCLMMCAGRAGAACSNVFFGYLMDGHCEIPIFAVAGVVLVGAGLCVFAPKGGEKGTVVRDVEVAVIS